MFFEDEKDIDQNMPDIEISDSDTVSWDSILDNNDEVEEQVNTKPVSIEPEGKLIPENPSLEELDSDTINSIVSNPELSDFVQEVTTPAPETPTGDISGDVDLLNVTPSDAADDVSDDELMQILNDVSQAEYEQYTTSQPQPSREEEIRELAADLGAGDDIDSQLAQVASENEVLDEHDEILDERAPKTKEKPKSSPLIPALLFAIVVVFICFKLLSGYISEKNIEKEIAMNSKINQEQVDEDDIAVHSEDTLDELKPEEETKEVIDIVPTGRPDPFVPLEKYNKLAAANSTATSHMTLDGKSLGIINNIDYDSVNLPKPPKYYGDLSEITTKLMSIVVTGIMYDDNRPSAIISMDNNDYFVQRGDRLDNFKVVDIGRDYVKIALGKNIYKARIGEEFKISEFYGNSPYYKDKNSSGRQYWSSEDEFKERFANQSKYTSETDVPIYVK